MIKTSQQIVIDLTCIRKIYSRNIPFRSLMYGSRVSSISHATEDFCEAIAYQVHDIIIKVRCKSVLILKSCLSWRLLRPLPQRFREYSQ